MNKLGLDIDELRKLCNDNNFKWTLHSLKRIRERGITSDEVIECIKTGEIIKQYEDDKPLPSCLMYGMVNQKHIHVVLSSDGQYIYFITTYYPNNTDWEDDFKTRREKK